MASPNEKWKELAKRTEIETAKVVPPVKAPGKAIRAAAADKKRLKQHLLDLVPAIKTAPIYLISTHGIYDLRKEPVAWKVPKNTYIFETQTIGDTTLTMIDSILWKLCLSKYRPAFFHYFMGNRWFFEKKGGKPLAIFTELFRNLILYKPGDIIYERTLSIGGGHFMEPNGSSRNTFENMGFYKFDLTTPVQNPPTKDTKRPMAPTEISELDNLRTALIIDEKFNITNKHIVDMVNFGTEIKYKGLKFGRQELLPAESFIFNDDEPVRIFIFSSCAALNCDTSAPLKSWPPIGVSQNEEQRLLLEHKKNSKAAYKSRECNTRLEKIESHQRDISNELNAMGIGTGPTGSGWDLDIEPIKDLGLVTPFLRPPQKKGMGTSAFLPSDYVDLYAEIDSDIADWWKLVGEEKGDLPVTINPIIREKMGGGKLTLRKTRKSRK